MGDEPDQPEHEENRDDGPKYVAHASSSFAVPDLSSYSAPAGRSENIWPGEPNGPRRHTPCDTSPQGEMACRIHDSSPARWLPRPSYSGPRWPSAPMRRER